MERVVDSRGTRDPSVLDRIVDVVVDPGRRHELDGALRALTHPLLDTVVTRRREEIAPIEETLAYAARQLSADLDDRILNESPIYSVGWIDAFLDVCAVGIDRGISNMLVQQAGRRLHVREILATLVERGPMNASALASAVGISANQLSNLLRWMEPSDLVRRSVAGRSTLVSLGPKGEAVYLALPDEAPADLPKERRERALVLVQRMAEKGHLASWLLRGFAGGHFGPVYLDADEAPGELLSSLFQDLSAADRERFKAAVVEAAGQWRAADGLQALRDLAHLALCVGAADIIRVLRGHIEQENIDWHSREGQDTIATLIAVLSGFRAMPQAYATLRRFFSDKRFHPEFTADLFIALCGCEPASYPLYLPHLLNFGDHYQTHRDSDRLQPTLATFISTAGWDTIWAHAHEVPRESLLQFIQIVGWVEVIVGLGDVPRDTLETFVFRGLTWSFVGEVLPALDDLCRARLVRLLCRHKLAELSWEGGACALKPVRPTEEPGQPIEEPFTHRVIKRTLYQETHTVEALYQMVGGQT